MGKDFRAAFSNMNKAVRPGAEQPVEQPVLHEYKQDLGQQRNFGQQIVWQKKKGN